MRHFVVALAGIMLFGASAAQAKVAITVDKDAQMMTVDVDGVPRYQWPVSTGNPSHETPNGTFQTFRMEASHFSKEFDDAPMPHAIFFTKFGHAIHGTESEGKLGVPVSHGCVRLSRAHAATLYDLVQKEGLLDTTVTLTGSSKVALARLQGNTAIAQRDPTAQTPDGTQLPAGQYAANGQYGQQNGVAGDPVMLTPPRQVPNQYAQTQYQQGQYLQQSQYPQPQYQAAQRPDDGYIYPADGSSDGARYPAPRDMGRRVYNVQANSRPQPYYYNGGDDDSGYAPQAYAPRPYYQPRGFYD